MTILCGEAHGRVGFLLDAEYSHKLLIIADYMGEPPYQLVRKIIDTMYKPIEADEHEFME